MGAREGEGSALAGQSGFGGTEGRQRAVSNSVGDPGGMQGEGEQLTTRCGWTG